MENENKNEVASTQPQVPSASQRRVTDGRVQGLDEVNMQEDLKMPRLSILQANSKIVTHEKGRMGEFANSITEENLGKEVDFIPLFLFKSRVQFEAGRGLVLLSRNNETVDFGDGDYEKYVGKHISEVPHAKDPRVPAIEWIGRKEPPSFSLVYNFLILRPSERINEFPMILSFLKTSADVGRDFLSTITYTGEDPFARVYRLTSTIEDNDKGRFAVPRVNFLRRCTDEEYEIAQRKFRDLFKKRKDIAAELNHAAEE